MHEHKLGKKDQKKEGGREKNMIHKGSRARQNFAVLVSFGSGIK